MFETPRYGKSTDKHDKARASSDGYGLAGQYRRHTHLGIDGSMPSAEQEVRLTRDKLGHYCLDRSCLVDEYNRFRTGTYFIYDDHTLIAKVVHQPRQRKLKIVGLTEYPIDWQVPLQGLREFELRSKGELSVCRDITNCRMVKLTIGGLRADIRKRIQAKQVVIAGKDSSFCTLHPNSGANIQTDVLTLRDGVTVTISGAAPEQAPTPLIEATRYIGVKDRARLIAHNGAWVDSPDVRIAEPALSIAASEGQLYILDGSHLGLVGKRDIFDGEVKIAEISHSNGELSVRLLTDKPVRMESPIIGYAKFSLSAIGKVAITGDIYSEHVDFALKRRLDLYGSIDCGDINFSSDSKGKSASRQIATLHDNNNHLHADNLSISGCMKLAVKGNQDKNRRDILQVDGQLNLDKTAKLEVFYARVTADRLLNQGALSLTDARLNVRHLLQEGRCELLDSHCTSKESISQTSHKARFIVKGSKLTAQTYSMQAGDLVANCSRDNSSEITGGSFLQTGGKLELLAKTRVRLQRRFSTSHDSALRIDVASLTSHSIKLLGDTAIEKSTLLARDDLDCQASRLRVQHARLNANRRVLLVGNSETLLSHVNIITPECAIKGAFKLAEDVSVHAHDAQFNTQTSTFLRAEIHAGRLSLTTQHADARLTFAQSTLRTDHLHQAGRVHLCAETEWRDESPSLEKVIVDGGEKIQKTDAVFTHVITGELSIEDSRIATAGNITQEAGPDSRFTLRNSLLIANDLYSHALVDSHRSYIQVNDLAVKGGQFNVVDRLYADSLVAQRYKLNGKQTGAAKKATSIPIAASSSSSSAGSSTGTEGASGASSSRPKAGLAKPKPPLPSIQVIKHFSILPAAADADDINFCATDDAQLATENSYIAGRAKLSKTQFSTRGRLFTDKGSHVAAEQASLVMFERGTLQGDMALDASTLLHYEPAKDTRVSHKKNKVQVSGDIRLTHGGRFESLKEEKSEADAAGEDERPKTEAKTTVVEGDTILKIRAAGCVSLDDKSSCRVGKIDLYGRMSAAHRSTIVTAGPTRTRAGSTLALTYGRLEASDFEHAGALDVKSIENERWEIEQAFTTRVATVERTAAPAEAGAEPVVESVPRLVADAVPTSSKAKKQSLPSALSIKKAFSCEAGSKITGDILHVETESVKFDTAASIDVSDKVYVLGTQCENAATIKAGKQIFFGMDLGTVNTGSMVAPRVDAHGVFINAFGYVDAPEQFTYSGILYYNGGLVSYGRSAITTIIPISAAGVALPRSFFEWNKFFSWENARDVAAAVAQQVVPQCKSTITLFTQTLPNLEKTLAEIGGKLDRHRERYRARYDENPAFFAASWGEMLNLLRVSVANPISASKTLGEEFSKHRVVAKKAYDDMRPFEVFDELASGVSTVRSAYRGYKTVKEVWGEHQWRGEASKRKGIGHVRTGLSNTWDSLTWENICAARDSMTLSNVKATLCAMPGQIRAYGINGQMCWSAGSQLYAGAKMVSSQLCEALRHDLSEICLRGDFSFQILRILPGSWTALAKDAYAEACKSQSLQAWQGMLQIAGEVNWIEVGKTALTPLMPLHHTGCVVAFNVDLLNLLPNASETSALSYHTGNQFNVIRKIDTWYAYNAGSANACFNSVTAWKLYNYGRIHGPGCLEIFVPYVANGAGAEITGGYTKTKIDELDDDGRIAVGSTVARSQLDVEHWRDGDTGQTEVINATARGKTFDSTGRLKAEGSHFEYKERFHITGAKGGVKTHDTSVHTDDFLYAGAEGWDYSGSTDIYGRNGLEITGAGLRGPDGAELRSANYARRLAGEKAAIESGKEAEAAAEVDSEEAQADSTESTAKQDAASGDSESAKESAETTTKGSKSAETPVAEGEEDTSPESKTEASDATSKQDDYTPQHVLSLRSNQDIDINAEVSGGQVVYFLAGADAQPKVVAQTGEEKSSADGPVKPSSDDQAASTEPESASTGDSRDGVGTADKAEEDDKVEEQTETAPSSDAGNSTDETKPKGSKATITFGKNARVSCSFGRIEGERTVYGDGSELDFGDFSYKIDESFVAPNIGHLNLGSGYYQGDVFTAEGEFSAWRMRFDVKQVALHVREKFGPNVLFDTEIFYDASQLKFLGQVTIKASESYTHAEGAYFGDMSTAECFADERKALEWYDTGQMPYEDSRYAIVTPQGQLRGSGHAETAYLDVGNLDIKQFGYANNYGISTLHLYDHHNPLVLDGVGRSSYQTGTVVFHAPRIDVTGTHESHGGLGLIATGENGHNGEVRVMAPLYLKGVFTVGGKSFVYNADIMAQHIFSVGTLEQHLNLGGTLFATGEISDFYFNSSFLRDNLPRLAAGEIRDFFSHQPNDGTIVLEAIQHKQVTQGSPEVLRYFSFEQAGMYLEFHFKAKDGEVKVERVESKLVPQYIADQLSRHYSCSDVGIDRKAEKKHDRSEIWKSIPVAGLDTKFGLLRRDNLPIGPSGHIGATGDVSLAQPEGVAGSVDLHGATVSAGNRVHIDAPQSAVRLHHNPRYYRDSGGHIRANHQGASIQGGLNGAVVGLDPDGNPIPQVDVLGDRIALGPAAAVRAPGFVRLQPLSDAPDAFSAYADVHIYTTSYTNDAKSLLQKGLGQKRHITKEKADETKPVIQSGIGIVIHCPKGGVESHGADYLAPVGSVKIQSLLTANVVGLDFTLKRNVTKTRIGAGILTGFAGGLINDIGKMVGLQKYLRSTKKGRHDQFVPDVFVEHGGGFIRVLEGNLNVVGALLSSGGEFTLMADKGRVILKRKVLNHRVVKKGLDLGISFPGSKAIEALAEGGNLWDALKAEDPLLGKIHNLIKSGNLLEALVNLSNMGIQLYNDIDAFAAAYKDGSFGQMLMQRYGLGKDGKFNPKIEITFNYVDKKTDYQKLGPGHLSAGKVNIIAGEAIEIIDGFCVRAKDDMTIKAPQLLMFAAALKSRHQGNITSAMLGLRFEGRPDVGVGFQHSSSDGVTHVNASMTAGGNVHFEVDHAVLHGANISGASTSGSIKDIEIESLADRHKSKTTGGSASTSGDVKATYSRSNSKRVGSESGIHIKEGYAGLALGDVHLKGAHITTDGKDVFVARSLTTESIEEYQRGITLGVSCNLYDLVQSRSDGREQDDVPASSTASGTSQPILIPSVQASSSTSSSSDAVQAVKKKTKGSGVAIPTAKVTFGWRNYHAERHATVAGAPGSSLEVERVNGFVNTKLGKGVSVLKDQDFQVTIDVPIIRGKEMEKSLANIAAAYKKFTGTDMPAAQLASIKREVDEFADDIATITQGMQDIQTKLDQLAADLDAAVAEGKAKAESEAADKPDDAALDDTRDRHDIPSSLIDDLDMQEDEKPRFTAADQDTEQGKDIPIVLASLDGDSETPPIRAASLSASPTAEEIQGDTSADSVVLEGFEESKSDLLKHIEQQLTTENGQKFAPLLKEMYSFVEHAATEFSDLDDARRMTDIFVSGQAPMSLDAMMAASGASEAATEPGFMSRVGANMAQMSCALLGMPVPTAGADSSATTDTATQATDSVEAIEAKRASIISQAGQTNVNNFTTFYMTEAGELLTQGRISRQDYQEIAAIVYANPLDNAIARRSMEYYKVRHWQQQQDVTVFEAALAGANHSAIGSVASLLTTTFGKNPVFFKAVMDGIQIRLANKELPRGQRLAHQAASLVFDLPVYATIARTTAGLPSPVVGAAVFGVPTGISSTLQSLNDYLFWTLPGERSFNDFTQRYGGAITESTMRSATAGALFFMARQYAGSLMSKGMLPNLTSASANNAINILAGNNPAAMTMLGQLGYSAMDAVLLTMANACAQGEAPDPDAFVDTFFLFAGMNVARQAAFEGSAALCRHAYGRGGSRGGGPGRRPPGGGSSGSSPSDGASADSSSSGSRHLMPVLSSKASVPRESRVSQIFERLFTHPVPSVRSDSPTPRSSRSTISDAPDQASIIHPQIDKPGEPGSVSRLEPRVFSTPTEPCSTEQLTLPRYADPRFGLVGQIVRPYHYNNLRFYAPNARLAAHARELSIFFEQDLTRELYPFMQLVCADFSSVDSGNKLVFLEKPASSDSEVEGVVGYDNIPLQGGKKMQGILLKRDFSPHALLKAISTLLHEKFHNHSPYGNFDRVASLYKSADQSGDFSKLSDILHYYESWQAAKSQAAALQSSRSATLEQLEAIQDIFGGPINSIEYYAKECGLDPKRPLPKWFRVALVVTEGNAWTLNALNEYGTEVVESVARKPSEFTIAELARLGESHQQQLDSTSAGSSPSSSGHSLSSASPSSSSSSSSTTPQTFPLHLGDILDGTKTLGSADPDGGGPKAPVPPSSPKPKPSDDGFRLGDRLGGEQRLGGTQPSSSTDAIRSPQASATTSTSSSTKVRASDAASSSAASSSSQRFFASSRHDARTFGISTLSDLHKAIGLSPTEAEHFLGLRICHGTDKSQVGRIKTGIEEIGSGPAGPGFYTSVVGSDTVEKTVLHTQRKNQDNYDTPVRMEGKINPERQFRVARIVMGKDGNLPLNWSNQPDFVNAVYDNYDIIEFVHENLVDPSKKPAKHIVFTKKAGSDAIIWESVIELEAHDEIKIDTPPDGSTMAPGGK